MISGTIVPLGVLRFWTLMAALNDGAGLHDGDLRIGDGQTAAAVTHHGVELVQGGDDGLDLGDGLAHVLGEQLDVGLLGRARTHAAAGSRKRMVTGQPSMAS